MYTYKFHKKVFKFLEKQDKKLLKKLKEKIKILCEDPYNRSNFLDCKVLSGSKNSYRLRIWKYRFLYTIIKKEILIYFYKADSRWDIYKK